MLTAFITTAAKARAAQARNVDDKLTPEVSIILRPQKSFKRVFTLSRGAERTDGHLDQGQRLEDVATSDYKKRGICSTIQRIAGIEIQRRKSIVAGLH